MPSSPLSLPLDRPHPLRPPPAYAQLRGSSPVARVTVPGGRAAWLVTSYAAAATVLSDARFGVVPPGSGAEGMGADSLLQDGEPHARLRRLVGKAFTPRSTEKLGPRIEQVAGELTEAMAAAGPPADLVEDFAAPLSILVISELLGVSIEDREEFRRFADAASAADPFAFDLDEESAAAMGQAWYAFAEFIAGLVASKRAALGDDLLSDLIGVRDAEDGRLSDNELTMLATTIVASGYLTARNAISVGALQLLTEGRLGQLAGNDAARVDAVLEDLLRRQIGLIGEPFPRYAQEDLEFFGASLTAGDLVIVRLEAANQDPTHASDPHLSFGRGPHYCLGASLARVEIRTALCSLAARFPGLGLDGSLDDVEWVRGSVDAGPVAVRIRW